MICKVGLGWVHALASAYWLAQLAWLLPIITIIVACRLLELFQLMSIIPEPATVASNQVATCSDLAKSTQDS